MKFPPISIIIPTYNVAETLGKCLLSIRKQDYPKDKIEVLVVDDASGDNTAQIAAELGAKVLLNGQRNIEIGKSIGLKNAKNDFVLFMDGDNALPGEDWLKRLIKPLLENKDVTASEAIWFKYRRGDPLANRYCSLFGINDPAAFYLRRRDRFMQTEKNWHLPGEVIDKGDYFLVSFNLQELPTLGSQGFLTRKKLLMETNWKPFFFHMDSNYELVSRGYTKYAMVKEEIEHFHTDSIRTFIKKCKRNIDLFLLYEKRRKYKWQTPPARLIFTVLLMVTWVKPTYDAFRGFLKLPDIAWFLHPLFSFLIPIIYAFAVVKWKLKKLFI
jgi:glycosyltransferase involved in cell wall biosynthesis